MNLFNPELYNVWFIFSLLFFMVLYRSLPINIRNKIGLIHLIPFFAVTYFAWSISLSGESKTVNIGSNSDQPEQWTRLIVRAPLNVRTCAATTCASLDVIKAGRTIDVDISSKQNDWMQAKYDKKNGWVNTLWLTAPQQGENIK